MIAWLLAALLVLVGAPALAAPTVTIRAHVDDDLRGVRGRLVATGLDEATWHDALSDLPMGEGDLEQSRLWPGRTRNGAVTWRRDGDALVFEARLPHRRGDVGWTWHGLLANGAWHPVPLVDGELPIVRWDVDVTLPEGVLGVLGDSVGPGRVRWRGEAERASLAAVRDGMATLLEGPGYDVVVVSRGRPRGGLHRELPRQLGWMAVPGATWRGVIVEAPLRLDLVRPGVEVAYLSDLALEVFPGLHRLHAEGVATGLATAWTPSPDPLVRAVSGAALGYRHRLRVGAELQARALVGLRWLSIVDGALLADDMRFKDAVLQEPAPTRPLGDDLVDRFRPQLPGGVMVGQLRTRIGGPAVVELAEHLARGAPLDEALVRVGADPEVVGTWRRPQRPQNYTVRRLGGVFEVRRDAPPDAAPEPVTIEVGGERRVWEVPEGPATIAVGAPFHRRVVVDPDRTVAQTTRLDDRRPQGTLAVATALLGRVDFLREFVEAELAVSLRGAADTHNRATLGLFSNERDRIGGQIGWTRMFGRPTLRTVREHAIGVFAEASWIDPAFERTTSALISLGGRLVYDWDNRQTALFPRRGSAARLSLEAGGAPDGGDAYVRGTARVLGTVSPHPRIVFAGRLVSGFAIADAVARRLRFGGGDAVRALPDVLLQPTAQAIVSAEVRPVLVDQAAVPIGLGTLNTVYLLGGVDVGVASASGLPYVAVGVNAGVGLVFSVLGVTPGSLHLNVGVPVVTKGLPQASIGLPVTVLGTWGVSF